MIFLKRTVPLLITFVTGLIMIAAFFAGPDLTTIAMLYEVFPKWVRIISGFTMVLGAASLLRLNLMKVSRRVEGWGYNLTLVVGFLAMVFFGMLSGIWPMVEKGVQPGEQYWLMSEVDSKRVTVVSVEGPGNIEQMAIVKDLEGNEFREPSYRLRSNFMSWMYAIHLFMFTGVFKQAQATMFSLLAFFVASASFRAFRVKSREAMLLMGAAFIVMIGNVPVGNYITQMFSKVAFGPFSLAFIDITALKEWILTYPSSAAQSAIMIGAALGAISASMKVMLGVERSHLGGEG